MTKKRNAKEALFIIEAGYKALALIEAEKGLSVAGNLGSFQGLTPEIALALIYDEDGGWVAQNLGSFDGLDSEVALALIAAGYGGWVANNLGKFEGLNHTEIAQEYIEAENHDCGIIYTLGLFQVSNYTEIILAISKNDPTWAIEDCFFEEFRDLNLETALGLIEAGEGENVAYNLKSFKGLNTAVAKAIITAGSSESVADNLGSFEGLNYEIAAELIDEGYGRAVVENLSIFEGVNHDKLELKLINVGDDKLIVEYLGYLSKLDNPGKLDSLGVFTGLDNLDEIAANIPTKYLDNLGYLDSLGVFIQVGSLNAIIHELRVDGHVEGIPTEYLGYLDSLGVFTVLGNLDEITAENLATSYGWFGVEDISEYGFGYLEAHAGWEEDEEFAAAKLIEDWACGYVAKNMDSFFEALLCYEPDALLASRSLPGADRDTITITEFSDLLEAARAVAAYTPTVRELPAHAG